MPVIKKKIPSILLEELNIKWRVGDVLGGEPGCLKNFRPGVGE